jgi:hypothetical protein
VLTVLLVMHANGGHEVRTSLFAGVITQVAPMLSRLQVYCTNPRGGIAPTGVWE